jgi:hypothetical protein
VPLKNGSRLSVIDVVGGVIGEAKGL